MVNKQKGKVWLVGAGPSDPGLFTLKGKAVLEQAEVVVYDKLVGDGVLAMIPQEAELIDVGKIAGNHPVPQWEINEILLKQALCGKRVVRLKGGDPFVFGRGGEELELLTEHNIPFEVVPGITSAVSVPAYNGIPVTHRSFTSSFHVITGHTKSADEADVDYASLVKLNGTLIFLMGVGSMGKICKGLMNAGMDKDMPAAVLERGTTAHQRRVVSTIAHLHEDAQKAEIKTPAIIIVGRVCSLSDDFAWAEKRPLGRIKIAVTRPRDRASKLAEQLKLAGAEVVLLPAIRTEAISDNKMLKKALAEIESYSWLAFTSPAGVNIFFETLKSLQLDIRILTGLKVAAIGSGTAKALWDRGISTDLVPQVYHGGALGTCLAETVKTNEKILIPRAAIGTAEVIKPLEAAGLMFDDIPIYDTLTEEENSLVSYDESVDVVAFTSASTVHAFAAANKTIDLSAVKAMCIGEQTASAASQYGMDIMVSPKATIDAMVTYMIEKFGE